jgi:hypothetical protein
LGYEVKHVRNYTDVGHLTSDEDAGEDKMEKGARREGLKPEEIAEKYIGIFEQDTRELNMLEPTVKPKATEHIKEMIDMTQILLNKNYAYSTEIRKKNTLSILYCGFFKLERTRTLYSTGRRRSNLLWLKTGKVSPGGTLSAPR